MEQFYVITYCKNNQQALIIMKNIALVILAAGQSSRMKSHTSKVLHKVAGWTVLRHVLQVGLALEPERVVLVTSPDADDIVAEARAHAPNLHHAVQVKAAGTGDAVRAALPHLQGFSGTVLILYGDSPLMTEVTLRTLVHKARECDVALTAMTPQDPAHYGRIKLNPSGDVEAIVEFNDANATERAIGLCNAGVIAFNATSLPALLAGLTNHNTKGEYYLTDCVALAVSSGLRCCYIVADEEEMLGVNTRAELAYAEGVMQRRLRGAAMAAGVGMVAPDTVFLSMDTRFGRDVLIHPYAVFGAGVTVADGAEIKSFSHIEGADIGESASVGPFARLRKGTRMGRKSAVGNFVEVKNSVLHEGVKAGHLSYLGDAEIGEHTNIGAGTITCNYDGTHKHKTTIGAHVFVGSDTSLVAPVTVGDHVTIAAGSVITDNVSENSLAIGRARQVVKKGWIKKQKE
jgi:bifunctional UDP-N-acetylglucosamine pyrophosphorylase / glucosamine-1-phosphate N-acetyltransferase